MSSTTAELGVKITATADMAGVEKTKAAVGTIGKELTKAKEQMAAVRTETARFYDEVRKKMSGANIGKSVLEGLGIGTGFQAANTIAGKLTDHFREAAEAAQRMAEMTERSLELTKSMIALKNRDNIEAQRKLLEDDAKRAQKAFDEANAPKFRTIRQTDEDGRVVSVDTVLIERTEKEAEALKKLEIAATEARFALDQFDAKREDKSKDEDKVLMKSAVDQGVRNILDTAKATNENRKAAVASAIALRQQGEAMQASVDPAKALELKLREIDRLEKAGAISADTAKQSRDEARRAMSREVEQIQRILELKQQEIDTNLAALDSDYSRADVEKWAERRALMQQALVNAQAYLEAMRKIRDAASTPEAKAQGDANVMQAQRGVSGAKRDLAATGPDPRSFSAQLIAANAEAYNSLGTLQQQSARLWMKTSEDMRTSMGGALGDIALQTGTFKEKAQAASYAVYSSFVRNAIQMGVNWAWQHTVMAGVSRVFRTQEVAGHATAETAKTGWSLAGAIKRRVIILGETLWHGVQVAARTASHIGGEVMKTTVTIAQTAIRLAKMAVETGASLIQAGIKAMSAVASIPYVGPILAVAALAAIIAAGKKVMTGKGFSDGGYTGGSNRTAPAGVVHEGEWVAPMWMAKDKKYAGLIAWLEAERKGRSGGRSGDSRHGYGIGGWASWGQFLGSGMLPKWAVIGPNKRFQEKWNLLDGTQLYGYSRGPAKTAYYENGEWINGARASGVIDTSSASSLSATASSGSSGSQTIADPSGQSQPINIAVLPANTSRSEVIQTLKSKEGRKILLDLMRSNFSELT